MKEEKKQSNAIIPEGNQKYIPIQPANKPPLSSRNERRMKIKYSFMYS